MSNVRRLPGPIVDLWDWQRLGACRGRDSAQFFHPDGERGSSRLRRESGAKAVCRACPVRAECAAHALSVREPYGVWGGFSGR
ncbi:WhiB family transcriptional regulator [Micromonospora sp. 4G55]|nr:WhiB family transcriptional regulator [Micromonospora sp. 4G55]